MMCEQCVEIDEKIEHYRHISSRITDQPMLDGIKQLIEQLKAQEAALHPVQSSEHA
jgi:beta-phosphoglucomutase-like phosphatase (HAD superfamily)